MILQKFGKCKNRGTFNRLPDGYAGEALKSAKGRHAYVEVERAKVARSHHSASHADLQKLAAREAMRLFFPPCLSCKQHQCGIALKEVEHPVSRRGMEEAERESFSQTQFCWCLLVMLTFLASRREAQQRKITTVEKNGATT